jgi:hypothetical protein
MTTLATNNGEPVAYVRIRQSGLYDRWISDQLSRNRDSRAPETRLGFGELGVVIHDHRATTIAFVDAGHGAKVSLGQCLASQKSRKSLTC